MTISAKQFFFYLTMMYFIVFSLAFSEFFFLSHYKFYAANSYLFGLFSHFNIFAVLLVVMAAVLEELGFRGFFTKNRYLFIAGSSMFLTYIETSIYYRFIIKLRIAHTPYAIISSYKNTIYFLPENIALLVIILFVFKIDFPNFIMKNKLCFIFISSIFFALAHTTGLWAAAVPWYFPLFFVLPQFCIGLLLGVIRVKYNLISSIFLHFFFDFFLIIVMSTVRSTGFIPVVHTILAIFSIFILFVFYACGFFNSIFLIKNRASKLITQMG